MKRAPLNSWSVVRDRQRRGSPAVFSGATQGEEIQRAGLGRFIRAASRQQLALERPGRPDPTRHQRGHLQEQPLRLHPGTDGHLWVNWWDGNSWRWSDQGGQIQLGISAVTYKNNLYAFTRGTDGHLWVNWWDGNSWRWSDQGGQIQLGISAVTYKNNLYAFTRGTDGHLWVNWWDGNSWRWSDQGGQIQLGISAVTYKNNLYAFTRGTDGHLWVNWWG